MLNLNVLLCPKCINKKYGYFQHIKLNSNEHSLEDSRTQDSRKMLMDFNFQTDKYKKHSLELHFFSSYVIEECHYF